MKKSIFLTMGLALLLAACQDPEYVSIDNTRQGITSLTATFTEGPYAESDAVVWNITPEDYAKDRFVIPVPWFFPVDSDNPTEDYMETMKVTAVMNNNFILSPTLGTLDLNQENWFTLTAPDGSSRQICIIGERTKSDACEMVTFSLVEPAVTGVIDNESNTISLISADDLSSCLANFQVSAHATISPDPSTTPLNYNEPVELTVTAHNGTTSRTYTVVKNVPAKIDYGFNTESLKPLFNIDATNIVGIPWEATNAPSMGAIGNSLVVCMGDGTTPFYLNRITGSREGEINLGSATAASITSDEGDHLLIANHAEGGQTFEIYTTSSVTEAPTLFTSFSNSSSFPMGYEMKVIGNIATNATIIVTNEGVSGVTNSSTYTRIRVIDGAVQAPEVIDIAATGLSWGASPVNGTNVVAASTDPADGCFLCYYSANQLNYIDGSNTVAAMLEDQGVVNGNVNPNNLDSKQFNNARYMALFVVSHFPMWGAGPQLYVYDITDMSKFSGTLTTAPALVLANSAIEWYQTATSSTASGDVLIAPSADGYSLYIYYYDNNCGTIGAYVADCIDD